MVPHDPPTLTYTPGIMQSLNFPGVQLAPVGYETHWYVIGNDSVLKENCLIRLIHDYSRPELKQGGLFLIRLLRFTNLCATDEEAPGQFCHQQFLYDREADYPRGESKNLHGGRVSLVTKSTGRAKVHTNFKPLGAVARVRIGLPDKAFFPFDSTTVQMRAREMINRNNNVNRRLAGEATIKASTFNRAAARAGGTLDQFGDLQLPLIPLANFPPSMKEDAHSRTNCERMGPNTAYSMLIDLIQSTILEDLRHRTQFFTVPGQPATGNGSSPNLLQLAQPKVTGAISEQVWHDLMVTIVEKDRTLGLHIIPEQIRQDLLFGVYEEVKIKDVKLMDEMEAKFKDEYLEALKEYIVDDDDDKLLPTLETLDGPLWITKRVRMDDPDWNQRKRFLFWGMEYVLSTAYDALKVKFIDRVEYNKSRKEYSNYWGDCDHWADIQLPPNVILPNLTNRTLQLPHPLDIVLVPTSAAKRKADGGSGDGPGGGSGPARKKRK